MTEAERKAIVEAEFAAFDRLPKSVRKAFANAKRNYSVQRSAARYRAHTYKARDLVRFIRQWDTQ